MENSFLKNLLYNSIIKKSSPNSPFKNQRFIFVMGEGFSAGTNRNKDREDLAKSKYEAKEKAQKELKQKETETLSRYGKDENSREKVGEAFQKAGQEVQGKIDQGQGLTNEARELLIRQTTEQLDAQLAHEEMPEYIILKGKDVANWMEKIAQKYQTTVEALIEANPGKIHVITEKQIGKGQIQKRHLGLHYVHPNTELRIPNPNKITKQITLDEEVRSLISESGAKMQEDAQKDRAERYQSQVELSQKNQSLEQSALLKEVSTNYQTLLIGQSIPLPKFLKEAQSQGYDAWSRALGNAGQKQEAQYKRVFDLIDDAPLVWLPGKFLDTILRGKNTLQFKDFTKEQFGENETSFIKRYESLDGLIKKTIDNDLRNELYAEKSFREAVMMQAFQIMQALKEIQQGETSLSSNPKQASENVNLEELKTTNPEAYTRELASQAFRNRDQAISLERASSESQLYRETTGLLRADGRSALNAILRDPEISTLEKGKTKIDHQKLLEKINYFLKRGIEAYSADKRLNILTELQVAHIPVAPQVSLVITQLDEQIAKHAKTANSLKNKNLRIKERAENATGKRKEELLTEIKENQQTIESLEKTIVTAQNQKMGLLEPSVTALSEILAIHIEASDPAQSVTDQQARFIQNGYHLAMASGDSKIARLKEVYNFKTELDKNQQQAIEKYQNNPLISEVFEELGQSGRLTNISPEQLNEIAQTIEQALRQDFELQPLDQILLKKSPLNLAIFRDGEARNTVFGAFRTVNLPGVNMDLTLGAGAIYKTGQTEVQAGVSGSSSVELRPHVILISSLEAGVSAGTRGTSAGVAKSFTRIHEIQGGDWQISQGLDVGVGVKNNRLQIGVNARLGVQRTPESYLRQAQQTTSFEAGTNFISDENIPRLEKVTRLKEMAQFRNLSLEIANFPQTMQEEILLHEAQLYDQQAREAGEANMPKGPKLLGAGLNLPSMIPYVVIGLFGETRIYCAVQPEQLKKTQDGSDKKLQAQLNQLASETGQKTEIRFIGDSNATQTAQNLSRLSYNLEGQQMITPRSSVEYQRSLNDLLNQKVEVHDKNLNQIGLNLAKGQKWAKGLLKLEIDGLQNPELPADTKPRVEVRIDPWLKGKLVFGDPPSVDNLHLAIDQMQGENLIITREEFIMPKQYLGAYTHTRITIKANPDPQVNFRYLEDQKSDLLIINPDGNIIIAGKNNGDILTKAEYEKGKEDFEALGYTTEKLEAYFASATEITNTQLPEIIAGNEAIAINTKEQIKFAQDFFKSNKKMVLASTLFDKDMGTDYAKLAKSIRENWKGSPLTDQQMDFILSILRKQTYVAKERNDQEAQNYLRTHRELFRIPLIEEFGAQAAPAIDQILNDLINTTQTQTFTVPADAQIFTTVARNGIRGIRADLLGDIPLERVTVISGQARLLIIKKLHELPAENTEFLQSALALKTFALYGLLKGKEATEKITAIYKNPALIENADYTSVFNDFKKLVEQVRAAELSEKAIVVTTDYGMQFAIEVKTHLIAGVNPACDNPTFVPLTEIIPSQEQTTIGAKNLEIIQAQTKIITPYRLFLAAYHPGKNQPAPQPSGQPDETLNADTGQQGHPTEGDPA
ncbi:MAG: hypothetical protein UT55_C0079G0002, partial [Candidatus Peregrinibacteria bacterium GW2011_GWE2_39_6]